MLAKLDYLSVHETRPGEDVELVWHEFGNPVAWEIVAPATLLRSEPRARRLEQALEQVLRGAESIPGPLWLQFDAKSPSLAALDWERLIYSSVAKPVSRVRRWTLPAFRRSPLGSVLILVADSVFDKETGGIVNELVQTARDQGDGCVLAAATTEAVRRAGGYWNEPYVEHFSATLTLENDLKRSLSELQRSFDTLFVIADPWWSDGEPGLRIGNEEFARFVAAPEIVRTAVRLGAARLVLITSPARCAEIARMLAHRAAEEAPIDVDLLVVKEGSVADSVRSYLESLFEDSDQVEQYDPATVLRYESPFASRQFLDRYPSSKDWIQFGLNYLGAYTMARQLGTNQALLDAPWRLPVQRIFEKYAAAPFELLIETGEVPSDQDEPGGSWSGVLEALRDMKAIFGGDDERDDKREKKPLPRLAR